MSCISQVVMAALRSGDMAQILSLIPVSSPQDANVDVADDWVQFMDEKGLLTQIRKPSVRGYPLKEDLWREANAVVVSGTVAPGDLVLRLKDTGNKATALMRSIGAEDMEPFGIMYCCANYCYSVAGLLAMRHSDLKLQAICLANRSALLIEIGEWEQALAAAIVSISADPVYLKPYYRAIQCAAALGDKSHRERTLRPRD
jgi:hypothetical protein